MRLRLAGWLLQGLVLLQRDLRDDEPRTLRPDWLPAFLRLVVVMLTVELAIATCTLGKLA